MMLPHFIQNEMCTLCHIAVGKKLLLLRDILQAHATFFNSVWGYADTHTHNEKGGCWDQQLLKYSCLRAESEIEMSYRKKDLETQAEHE